MQHLVLHHFLLYAFTAVFALTACGRPGSSDRTDTSGDDKSNNWREGTITLEFNGEEFQDDVRVYHSETDGLTMLSDDSDVKDSDGDGLIVSIFELNDKLHFDLVDSSTRYGGQITNWSKDGDVIEGEGSLTKENEFSKQGLTFRLTLND